jgi:hypothetical protein
MRQITCDVQERVHTEKLTLMNCRMEVRQNEMEQIDPQVAKATRGR